MNKSLRIKIIFTYFFVLLGFSLIIIRLYFLQCDDNSRLSKLSSRQHKKTIVKLPRRGNIFDRNMEKFAVSIDVSSIAINPKAISDIDSLAKKLSKILSIDEEDIIKGANKDKYFAWIKRYVSPAEANAIEKLDHKGIISIKEKKRFYTQRELASNLIGFINNDQVGLSGLELKYNEYLQGQKLLVEIEKDARGRVISNKIEADLSENSGSSLVLTIDKRIQYMVEMELNKAVVEYKAQGGLAIAMNPKTGELLAMASIPNFNPNIFWRYPPTYFRNRGLMDLIEPGSLFKIVVLSAGLEEELITLNTKINCENGTLNIGNNVIHDIAKRKKLTVRDIIKYSSNIGSFKIADLLGKEKLYEYIGKFGFGLATNIDLPAEEKGLVKSINKLYPIDFANLAFGQGISITALQIINAFNVIANGGSLMKPYVVKQILNSKGRITKEFKPSKIATVISKNTANQVKDALVDVVNAVDGSGKNAKMEDYIIAGKTGTSQKIVDGKYSKESYMALFSGMIPADDPQMTLIVMIDEPKNEIYGGKVAAPIFKNIAKKVVAYLGISPDDKISIAEKMKISTQEEYKTKENTEAKKLEDESDNIKNTESKDQVMANFLGKGLREVVADLKSFNYRYELVGQGVVYKQEPLPGSELSENNEVKIYLKREI
ncbi:MAG: penicillin-binding transpeptidase domain-containing protein [Pseudomonadota bacterium]